MDEPSLLAPPSEEDATDAAAALRVVNDVTGFDGGCLLDLRTALDGRLNATTKADVVVVVVAEKAHHHKHKRSDDEIVIAFMVYVVR